MKHKGFTLIEMLTVVAIIALLLCLFSPGLMGIKLFAYRLQCGKSMEQLGKGWTSYSAENDFNIVSSNTGWNNDCPNHQRCTCINRCWVGGGNTIESMEMGQLWPYVGSIEVYECTTPRSNPEYYRHFSINGRLNGERNVTKRFTGIPDPSRTFLMMEEDDYRGYNVNSWFIGSRNNWVDFVSGNHDEGDNVLFVDGHIEYWKWLDEDTLTLPYSDAPFGSPDPGSVDLERIWEAFRPY